MTLAERIAAYRVKTGLSQAKFAEVMEVSRQSVSKWETGASVPELEKLVQMTELFHCTLDELVRGESAPPTPSSPAPSPAPEASSPKGNTQRILGFVLLAAGLIGVVVGLAVHLLAAAVGLYLLLTGVLCLVIRRHAEIWILWINLLPLLFLSPRLPAVLRWEAAVWIKWGLWLFAAAAAVWTVLTLRKERKNGSPEQEPQG